MVADLPFSSPVFASTNAPVQTDMVTSVVFEDFLIHSNTAGLGALCAGMTITFGGGIGYTEEGCADAELMSVESHMQTIFTTGDVTYSFNGQDLAIEKGDLGVQAREQE